MIRRGVALILLFINFSLLCSAQVKREPEPYKPEEFPSWARSLRRAEIVTVGLFPFILLFTSLAYDGMQFMFSGGDPQYAPGPFRGAGGSPLSQNEKVGIVMVSVSLSMVLAAVDYFIERGKKKGIP